MTLPNTLTTAMLATLAAPDEIHAVRVVLHKVSSQVPYRLRSKLRTYVFEKNRDINAHVLDVPVSVWMHGANNAARRGEGAICQDLQPTISMQLTIQVIPWHGAISAVQEDPQALRGAFSLLREIFTALNPPPVVFKALQHAENNEMEQLTALSASSKEPASGETPRQLQARKMREAKMKKRTELQTAAP